MYPPCVKRGTRTPSTRVRVRGVSATTLGHPLPPRKNETTAIRACIREIVNITDVSNRTEIRPNTCTRGIRTFELICFFFFAFLERVSSVRFPGIFGSPKRQIIASHVSPLFPLFTHWSATYARKRGFNAGLHNQNATFESSILILINHAARALRVIRPLHNLIA